MRKIENKRFRCIHASTASEFEAEIQAVYEQTPGAEVLFREQPFLAYATWIDIRYEPETVYEELKLAGTDLRCGDCPYLEQRFDKRVRYHSCKYADGSRMRSEPACELFCKRYIRGEVDRFE